MIQIGACCPVFIPILAETESSITYGRGVILGKMMNVSYKPTFAEGQVYGDDHLVIDEKEPIGGDITLGTTWLPFEAATVVFGKETPSGTEIITTEESLSKSGAFAFIKKARRDGKPFYVVKMFFKTKFTEPDESVTTKSGSIQYNTPSINGKVYMPLNGKLDYEAEFETIGEAKAKIMALANISSESEFVAQPIVYPDNSEAITATTNIFLACSTPGAVIYYTVNGDEPTVSSDEYTAPFTLAAAGTVKAIAVKGSSLSAVSSKEYIF